MPLVVELQASPLIGIDGVGLRSFEFAVGRRFVNRCTDGFGDRFMGDFMGAFVGDERSVRCGLAARAASGSPVRNV